MNDDLILLILAWKSTCNTGQVNFDLLNFFFQGFAIVVFCLFVLEGLTTKEGKVCHFSSLEVFVMISERRKLCYAEGNYND